MILGGEQMNIKLKAKGMLKLIGNNQTGIAFNPEVLKEAGLSRNDKVTITLTESNQLIIEKAK